MISDIFNQKEWYDTQNNSLGILDYQGINVKLHISWSSRLTVVFSYQFLVNFYY